MESRFAHPDPDEVRPGYTGEFEIGNDTSLADPVIDALTRELSDRWGSECGYIGVMIVALQEAISNAIYHGNLELNSDLRESDSTSLQNITAERRALNPWCQRKVHIKAEITERSAVFQITDEGNGFDRSQHRSCIDPPGLERLSGRGIAMMESLMDSVKYSNEGRQVTMTLSRTSL